MWSIRIVVAFPFHPLALLSRYFGFCLSHHIKSRSEQVRQVLTSGLRLGQMLVVVRASSRQPSSRSGGADSRLLKERNGNVVCKRVD